MITVNVIQAAAPEKETLYDTGHQDEKHESRPEVSIAGYPVVLYTPETSMIFGGGGALTVRKRNAGRSQRPDNMNFYAVYTLKNQMAVLVNYDYFSDLETWEFKILVNYQKFPDVFYGIGGDTSMDDEEKVVTEDLIVKPAITRRIYTHFRFGVTGHFNHSSVLETEPDGVLSRGVMPGSRGSTLSGIGPIAEWDSRDNIFYPSQGCWLQVSAVFYEACFGSEYKYSALVLDYRHYFMLKENHILAIQIYGKALDGEIPFNHYAWLDKLRGIFSSRFRDRSLMLAQAEYRYPVYKRFSGVLFAGAGDVRDKFSEFTWRDVKLVCGAGLRFAVLPSDNMNLRFDLGFSRYGTNMYFQLSEAF